MVASAAAPQALWSSWRTNAYLLSIRLSYLGTARADLGFTWLSSSQPLLGHFLGRYPPTGPKTRYTLGNNHPAGITYLTKTIELPAYPIPLVVCSGLQSHPQTPGAGQTAIDYIGHTTPVWPDPVFASLGFLCDFELHGQAADHPLQLGDAVLVLAPLILALEAA